MSNSDDAYDPESINPFRTMEEAPRELAGRFSGDFGKCLPGDNDLLRRAQERNLHWMLFCDHPIAPYYQGTRIAFVRLWGYYIGASRFGGQCYFPCSPSGTSDRSFQGDVR